MAGGRCGGRRAGGRYFDDVGHIFNKSYQNADLFVGCPCARRRLQRSNNEKTGFELHLLSKAEFRDEVPLIKNEKKRASNEVMSA